MQKFKTENEFMLESGILSESDLDLLEDAEIELTKQNIKNLVYRRTEGRHTDPEAAYLEKLEKVENLKKKIEKEFANAFDNDIKLFVDYNERISDESIQKCLDAESSLFEFNEMLNDWAAYDSDYDFEIFINEVKGRLTDEEKIIFDMENLECWLRENVYFYYDMKDWDRDVCVNIMLDTGDANYDFICNNIFNYYGNGTVDEHSSLLWLSKQQGKETEFKKAVELYREKGITLNDSFTTSLLEESENLSSPIGILTFCAKVPLLKLLNLHDLPKDFILGKETTCGLYDAFNGGGSLLNIKLDKDIVIPAEAIHKICVDSCMCFGGIHSVYGVNDSLWTDTFKGVKND